MLQLVDVVDPDTDIQMFISTHRSGAFLTSPPEFRANSKLVELGASIESQG